MTTRSCQKHNSSAWQAGDKQVRQKAQNRYAESMNDTQRKWIAVGVVATAVVLIGYQLLLASPPTFNQFAIGTVPGATLAPAAPVVASPSVAALGTASSQPKITWSTTSINVILSPGESTSSDLTFTTSQKLTNVILSVVPQIAPFVTVQPSSISSLASNQTQSVHLSIAIATAAAFGTYDGTLQVKSGTTTFPQTVKVTVNVWHTYTARFGLTIKYPPGWSTFTSTDQVVFSSTGRLPSTEDDLGDDVEIVAEANPANISPSEWVQNHFGIDISQLALTDVVTGSAGDGTPYVELIGTIPSADPDNAHAF